MGRFDNYIESHKVAEHEKLDKKNAEKAEQEKTQEEREGIYVPYIKKALLEFNDVLPKIKRWKPIHVEYIQRIFGIEKKRYKDVDMIQTVWCDDPDSTWGTGFWIGKDGKYYKRILDYDPKKPAGVTYVSEISLEEMAKSIVKCLPWDGLKYGYALGHGTNDKLIVAMHNGDAEEAAYIYFERLLEGKI